MLLIHVFSSDFRKSNIDSWSQMGLKEMIINHIHGKNIMHAVCAGKHCNFIREYLKYYALLRCGVRAGETWGRKGSNVLCNGIALIGALQKMAHLLHEKYRENDENCHIAFKLDKDFSQQRRKSYDDSCKTVRMAESVVRRSPQCRKSPETLFAEVPKKRADDFSEGHVGDDAFEELRKNHKGSINLGENCSVSCVIEDNTCLCLYAYLFLLRVL